MKKIFRTALSAAFLLLAALLIAGTASAGTPGGAGVTQGSNTTGSAGAAGTSPANGGYVTEINVTTTQQTSNWQGFWGNVTSNTIVLEDSGSNQMYSWTATNLASGGYVYATTKGTTPAWSSLANTTMATLDGSSYWNFGSRTDNITNTYTSTGTKTFAGTTVNSANKTTVNTNFNDYVVRDQSGSDRTQIIWIAEINNDKSNFKSTLSDYELLVPVVAGDTYRFYLEIL